MGRYKYVWAYRWRYRYVWRWQWKNVKKCPRGFRAKGRRCYKKMGSKRLRCPRGYKQVGKIGADIGGCGLQKCQHRYGKQSRNTHTCASFCNRNKKCKSFSWAPLNGDKAHKNVRVCTIYPHAK